MLASRPSQKISRLLLPRIGGAAAVLPSCGMTSSFSTTTISNGWQTKKPRTTISTADISRRTVVNLADTRLNTIPPFGTLTKVVCTIGPATDTPERITELMNKGMHVARLNFSHAGADYTYPQSLVDMIRGAKGKHLELTTGEYVSEGLSRVPKPNNLRAVLVDTKGPEIRTGPLQGNQDIAEIEMGAKIILTTEDVSGDPIPADGDTTRRIQIDYMSICKTVSVGAMILLDDGLIALEVLEIDPKGESYVVCEALNTGPIKKNKGVNLPDMELDLPALTDKDRRDLKWACEVGADFVAASFIRNGANVRSVIAYLNRCVADLPAQDGHARIRPLVISKIENKEGVDNFDEILDESDGIMVARGDLGVEIPYSKVFAAQRMMVSKCNHVGKPVIVATQMMDSMMRNPRPTRAEVTDVGTAVMDGTDAVMLSGETAAGKYPMESLKSMASVVFEADCIKDKNAHMIWNKELHDKLSAQEQELDAVAASAVKSANQMNVSKIFLISMSGRVARAVARHRPSVPVLSFCTDPQVARRLQLHRAIIPIMLQTTLDPGSPSTEMELLRAEAVRTAREMGFVKSGDRIILVDRTAGRAHDMHEYAHNLKVVTIRDL